MNSNRFQSRDPTIDRPVIGVRKRFLNFRLRHFRKWFGLFASRRIAECHGPENLLNRIHLLFRRQRLAHALHKRKHTLRKIGNRIAGFVLHVTILIERVHSNHNKSCAYIAYFTPPSSRLKNRTVRSHIRSATCGSAVYMCVTPGSGSTSQVLPARKIASDNFSVCR